ncbi:MAG TPA: hypothetical protein VE596_01220 [Gaiellaceae bacterium]|jgi:hypothetical protein|nr:hypothetical protein [Gaiellaceae bacterium]
MAKPTTVRIAAFVRPELDQLRNDLHAAGMPTRSKDDIPNALILAARRSPIEAIKAIVDTYIQRQAAEKVGGGTEERS